MPQLASKSVTAANTPEVLYTCPANKRATVNVSITSRDAAATTVRLYHSKAANVASLADREAIEFDCPLQGTGRSGNAIERTALTLAAGESLYMAGSSTLINFNAQGLEENA